MMNFQLDPPERLEHRENRGEQRSQRKKERCVASSPADDGIHKHLHDMKWLPVLKNSASSALLSVLCVPVFFHGFHGCGGGCR
jgi:hypothetical protein